MNINRTELQSADDTMRGSVGLSSQSANEILPIGDLPSGTKQALNDEEVRRLIDEQIELLKTEAQLRKQKRIGTATILVLAFATLAFLSASSGGQFHFGGNFFMFLGPALLGGMKYLSDSQKKAVTTIFEHGDIRAIGPMIDLMSMESKTGEGLYVVAYLVQTLPKLKASDAHLINPAQLAALHKYLTTKTPKSSSELAMAILKALQQVGNAQSVKTVEDLSEGAGLAWNYPEIRRAAIECLPYLRERERQLMASQTLLRGATMPEGSSKDLLRPAASHSEDPPELLLRASGTNHD